MKVSIYDLATLVTSAQPDGIWRTLPLDSLSRIDVWEAGKLQKIFCPWYRVGDAYGVGYGDEGAIPITVGEAALNLSKVSNHSQQKVLELQKVFCAEAKPSPVVLGYALPEEQIILIDGVHRSIALARSPKEFLLRVVLVHGPIHPEFMPDLQHWALKRD